MLAHGQKVPDSYGMAKALDYHLKRRAALTRYVDDGAVPIDNNWVENQFRLWVLGRSYAQSAIMCSEQHVAAIMSLIQSASLNELDLYIYLKDLLSRLPTQKNNAIDELLPQTGRQLYLTRCDGPTVTIKEQTKTKQLEQKASELGTDVERLKRLL